MRELREIRLRRGLSQADLSAMTGVAEFTISEIESGKRANPRPSTLRKLAHALEVEVANLYGDHEHPLREARSSPAQPPLNGFEDERPANWRAAVASARRLRELARPRMAELLASWQASKERKEDADERHRYLDAIGTLLQQAYDAETALIRALTGPRIAEQWPEVREADRFYVDLLRLVQGAGLGIRTRPDADNSEPAQHEVKESAAA